MQVPSGARSGHMISVTAPPTTQYGAPPPVQQQLMDRNANGNPGYPQQLFGKNATAKVNALALFAELEVKENKSKTKSKSKCCGCWKFEFLFDVVDPRNPTKIEFTLQHKVISYTRDDRGGDWDTSLYLGDSTAKKNRIASYGLAPETENECCLCRAPRVQLVVAGARGVSTFKRYMCSDAQLLTPEGQAELTPATMCSSIGYGIPPWLCCPVLFSPVGFGILIIAGVVASCVNSPKTYFFPPAHQPSCCPAKWNGLGDEHGYMQVMIMYVCMYVRMYVCMWMMYHI